MTVREEAEREVEWLVWSILGGPVPQSMRKVFAHTYTHELTVPEIMLEAISVTGPESVVPIIIGWTEPVRLSRPRTVSLLDGQPL